MKQTADEIIRTAHSWILEEFLPGEPAESLDRSTPLITSGILDSIGTVRLVSFLEEKFGVQVDAHEIGVDHLNTLSDIAALILSKQAG